MLLGLAIGEVLVRIFVGSPLPERLPILEVRANPLRGWEMIPNSHHFTYQHRVFVNSLGLRGPVLKDKGADEKRVLAIGDSMVFGQGVGDNDTIPARLEQCLCADGTRWCVINGGNQAYSTNQELALLCELGPQIAPDIVVLFWYWNDIEEVSIKRMFQAYQAEPSVPFGFNYRIEGWGKVRWYSRQLLRSSAFLMLAHDAWRDWGAEPPPTAPVDDHLRKLSDYLDEFEEVCETLQCRFELFIIPDPGALAGEHVSDAIVRRVEKLAESRDLRLVDLKPALRKLYAESRRPTVPFDGHYNGEANAVIASEVAKVLRTLE